MLAAVPAFELIMRVSLGARAAAPLGVLANGVVQGCLTGLVAVGLILVYRTTRIINFAQASLGSVAAIVVTLLVQNYNLPFIVVVPLGLGFAVAAGALAELLLRRFSKAPRLVVTIATIALAPLVQQLMNFLVQTLNPLPVGLERAQASLRKIPVPFSGLKFTIAPLTFGFAEVATVMGSITVMALLALFLRRTRVGSAVRGAAENSEAAWLLGINIRLLSTMVWALAAVLSGLGALFALMINGVDTSASDAGAAMMLPAIVAAMVAGMETMPVAMLFAIWFAVLEQAIHWAFPDAHFHEVGLLVATLVSLLLQRRRLQRRESKQGSAWEAAKDIRATPVQLRTVPLVRNGRYLLIGLGLLGVVIFPLVTVAGQLHAGGLVLITVMIVLSLMVLTGWAGQVSLGQFALVAVGGVFGAGLTSRYGLSFWLVLPLVSLLGAAVAVLLGLPSLRLRGLYLAAVTLAFALAVPVVLFSPQFFGFIQVEGIIDRPRLFFIDFTDERSFYYLLLICTVGWIYLTAQPRGAAADRAA